MYQQCPVLRQSQVSPGVYELELNVGEMAALSQPGQFVMIKSWEGNDPFFLRPISINSVDRAAGSMTLLYKVKGRGTVHMSHLKPGDTATVLGPLGKGFPVDSGARRVALIGRGIGIAPLLQLARDYAAQGTELCVYLSARQDSELHNKSAFEALGAVVRTTSNPQELITDRMAEDCSEHPFDAAYSCGSNRLGQAMQQLHKTYGFPAWISLERHMACGVGACKGCVCENKDPKTGEPYYARVCKDGPVFDVDEVM